MNTQSEPKWRNPNFILDTRRNSMREQLQSKCRKGEKQYRIVVALIIVTTINRKKPS